MRYKSAPVIQEERVETTRERAARQQQERRAELTYTVADYDRFAENRERVLRDRQEVAPQIMPAPMVFPHNVEQVSNTGFSEGELALLNSMDTAQSMEMGDLFSEAEIDTLSSAMGNAAATAMDDLFSDAEMEALSNAMGIADDTAVSNLFSEAEMEALSNAMDTSESTMSEEQVPAEEFMFSEADMLVLANAANSLMLASEPNSEGNLFSFSEDDLSLYTELKYPTPNGLHPSFSLDDGCSLPPLPLGRGLADCGQHASGITGGMYQVGTVALDNSFSPLDSIPPSMFERSFALTRDQFVTSHIPAKAQGIAFLIEATGGFHYGRLHTDGSVSQTDANSFGFLNSQREGLQRSTMDVVTLENKEAFALYCDIIYGTAGVYFYVYFN